jgi:hypothetical protein
LRELAQRLRDRCLNILRRRIDVAVERELQSDPRLEVDVMLSMPAMVENCFSSGVATAAAIVAGLAPGSEPLTVIVG